MSEKLDKIDLKILKILQDNSKITNLDLSKKIGLSPAPTLERVKKLEQSEIIQSYHAQVNPQQMGLNVKPSSFTSISGAIPRIRTCSVEVSLSKNQTSFTRKRFTSSQLMSLRTICTFSSYVSGSKVTTVSVLDNMDSTSSVLMRLLNLSSSMPIHRQIAFGSGIRQDFEERLFRVSERKVHFFTHVDDTPDAFFPEDIAFANGLVGQYAALQHDVFFHHIVQRSLAGSSGSLTSSVFTSISSGSCASNIGSGRKNMSRHRQVHLIKVCMTRRCGLIKM